ncbi:hypothetical protein Tco_0767636 [Tanacetum coccineum]
MALPPREQRHTFLRYQGLEYTNDDTETRLTRIYKREVHKVHVFNFGGLPDLMAEVLSGRMLMEHKDAQGVSLFTSQVWRRIFNIRGPLVHELTLEFFSTFRFGQSILDLDTPGALHSIAEQLDSNCRDTLLTTEILGGLTVIVPELPIINMVELVRLHICVEIDDTWAWVALGPERQPNAMAGAPAVAEDAPAADEGDQAVLAPV